MSFTRKGSEKKLSTLSSSIGNLVRAMSKSEITDPKHINNDDEQMHYNVEYFLQLFKKNLEELKGDSNTDKKQYISLLKYFQKEDFFRKVFYMSTTKSDQFINHLCDGLIQGIKNIPIKKSTPVVDRSNTTEQKDATKSPHKPASKKKKQFEGLTNEDIQELLQEIENIKKEFNSPEMQLRLVNLKHDLDIHSDEKYYISHLRKKVNELKTMKEKAYDTYVLALEEIIAFHQILDKTKTNNDESEKILKDALDTILSHVNMLNREAKNYCVDALKSALNDFNICHLTAGRLANVKRHLVSGVLEEKHTSNVKHLIINTAISFANTKSLKAGNFGIVSQVNVIDEDLKHDLRKLGLLDTLKDDVIIVKQVKKIDFNTVFNQVREDGLDLTWLEIQNLVQQKIKQQIDGFTREGLINTILLQHRDDITNKSPDKTCHYNLAIFAQDVNGEPLILMRRESIGKASEFLKSYNDNLQGTQITPQDIRAMMEVLNTIFKHVKLGLQQTHSIGIIEGDVWPDNILIDKPNGSEKIIARIIDFGLGGIFDKNDRNAVIRMKKSDQFFRTRAPYETHNGQKSTINDTYMFKIAILNMIAMMGGMDFENELTQLNNTLTANYLKKGRANQKLLKHYYDKVYEFFNTTTEQPKAICETMLMYLANLKEFFDWQYAENTENTNLSKQPQEIEDMAYNDFDIGMKKMDDILNSYDETIDNFTAVKIDFATNNPALKKKQDQNETAVELIEPHSYQKFNPAIEERVDFVAEEQSQDPHDSSAKQTQGNPTGNSNEVPIEIVAEATHSSSIAAQDFFAQQLSQVNPILKDLTKSDVEEDKGSEELFVINAAQNDLSYQPPVFKAERSRSGSSKSTEYKSEKPAEDNGNTPSTPQSKRLEKSLSQARSRSFCVDAEEDKRNSASTSQTRTLNPMLQFIQANVQNPNEEKANKPSAMP